MHKSCRYTLAFRCAFTSDITIKKKNAISVPLTVICRRTGVSIPQIPILLGISHPIACSLRRMVRENKTSGEQQFCGRKRNRWEIFSFSLFPLADERNRAQCGVLLKSICLKVRHVCKKWLFGKEWPIWVAIAVLSIWTILVIPLWPLTNTKHFHLQNNCSLDVCFFQQHSG